MRTLYHVTPWSKLPAILAQGIRPQIKPEQTGKLGQDVRTIKKAIFAFTSPSDAVGWALRMGWDKNDRMAIIQFTSTSRWVKDKHLEAQLARGKWVASRSPVRPEQITVVVGFSPKLLQSHSAETYWFSYDESPIKNWLEKEKEIFDVTPVAIS